MTEEIKMEFTFVVPDNIKKVQIPLEKAIEDWALEACFFLMEIGLEADKAGSVVANILLRQAWLSASLGKMAMDDKVVPNPERFMEAAEAATKAFEFSR